MNEFLTTIIEKDRHLKHKILRDSFGNLLKHELENKAGKLTIEINNMYAYGAVKEITIEYKGQAVINNLVKKKTVTSIAEPKLILSEELTYETDDYIKVKTRTFVGCEMISKSFEKTIKKDIKVI